MKPGQPYSFAALRGPTHDTAVPCIVHGVHGVSLNNVCVIEDEDGVWSVLVGGSLRLPYETEREAVASLVDFSPKTQRGHLPVLVETGANKKLAREQRPVRRERGGQAP